jgi:hypothetical protein
LQRRFAKSDMHACEVRPRKDHRGVDLISDVLLFGRLWYGEPNAITNAIGYANFRSRSHDAVIRVYDAAGNLRQPRRKARRASLFSVKGSLNPHPTYEKEILFPIRVL